MSDNENPTRQAKRLGLPLPIRVEVQENDSASWNEITHLKSVSPVGAGFLLRRSVTEGRMILLTMPLPVRLRRFDFSERQYCVWSLVRYCRPLPGDIPLFDTGVAFVGKQPPPSYRENHSTIYALTGIREQGLWEITEKPAPGPCRRQPRYAIPLNVDVTLCDETDTVIAQEQTVTENISRGGAAVFSNLPVQIGDLVKVSCEQYNTSLLAEVRDSRRGSDGLPRLHLQFVNAEFPLPGIEAI